MKRITASGKKALSVLVALALLLSYVPFAPLAGAAGASFFSDGFEQYSAGAAPQGYYCEQSADGLAITVASDAAAKSGAQSLLVSDQSGDSDSGRALIARQFLPVTTLTAEFDYLPISANTNSIGIFSGGTASPNGIFSINLAENGALSYYNGASVSTGVTLEFGTWYAIRFEATIAGGMDLYIDGEFIVNIPARAGFTAMDRIVFQGAGALQTGDMYYIDNLALSSPQVPTLNPPIFTDTFEGDDVGELPERYSSGDDAPAAQYDVIPSLKGYINSDTSPAEGSEVIWGHTGGNSLDYKNNSFVVDLGSSISIDAVRINNYRQSPRVNESNTNVYISDDNVNYTQITYALEIFADGDYLVYRFVIDDTVARYVKINSTFADIAYTLSVLYEQEDIIAERRAATFTYEPMTAAIGLLEYDAEPETGALANWDHKGGVGMDWKNTSLGVDLGEPISIDAIRFNGRTETTLATKSDFRVFYSDDNVTYTEIENFSLEDLTLNGLAALRFRFNAVTARYVKVTSVQSRTDVYSFAIAAQQEDVVAEYKAPFTPSTGCAAVTDAAAASGGKSLMLDGERDAAEVTRAFDHTTAARLSFRLYNEGLGGDVFFGFTAGEAKVIELRLSGGGALHFLRDRRWVPVFGTGAGAAPAGEWTDITVNIPQFEYKIELADIMINGEYVGSAYYNGISAGVDAIRFEAAGDVAYIDDIDMSAPDPARTIPSYDERDVAVYAPEVLSAIAGWLEHDDDPETGALAGWGETDGVALDWKSTSVGVDLSESRRVSAIRLYGSGTASPPQEDYELYHSDDNVTYHKVSGFMLNSYLEDGRRVQLFEFSGITARYIKVHSLRTGDKGYTFAVEDIRAECRAAREYRLPGVPGMLLRDANGAGALEVVRKSGVSMSLLRDASVGLDLGIVTDVDAVEIWAAGAPSASPLDFEVYSAGGDGVYSRVEGVVCATRAEPGGAVYRFSFDSLRAKWIKVRAAGGGSFHIADLQAGVRAFSSVEAASYFSNSFSDNRGAEGAFETKTDGTLIMGFNSFEGGTGDFDPAAIGARDSLDGGYTWGEEYIIQPNEGENVMNASYLRMQNGDLGMIYMVKEKGEIANVYIRRSTNDGESWTERSLITKSPQGYTIQSSGNRLLRLSTGRILLPVSWSAFINDCYGGFHTYAMIFYSDDDGYTWRLAPGSVNLANAALEPTLAELSGGEVFMSIRTRDNNSMYKAMSLDGGMSWTLPVKYALNSAGSTTTVAHIPATGDLLLMWNNAVGSGNNPRNPLSLAISRDNGETFQVGRNIFEGRVQSGNDFAFPVVAFYGRAVYLQFAATSGYTTALRIIDIDMLYHSVAGGVTLSDLPQAATPAAVYDAASGRVTGLTADMSYSLDGGVSWRAAGGETLHLARGTVGDELLLRDNGGYDRAPSDVQRIDTGIELFTVAFDSRGGSAVAPIIGVQAGDLISAPATPARAGYTFAGWYADAAYAGAAWDFGRDAVAGSMTLYARWVSAGSPHVPVQPGTPAPGDGTQPKPAATLSATGELTPDGILTAEIGADAINKALKAADETGLLEITLESDGTPEGMQVTLSDAAVKTLLDSGVETLVIKSGAAQLAFDAAALAALPAGDFVISLIPAQADGFDLVFDITLAVGGAEISDLGGGQLSVSFPYTPKPGEDADYLKVAFIDTDGSVTPLRRSCCEEGRISFATGHLSLYGLMYTPFSDLAPGAWYAEYVGAAFRRGYIEGVGAGRYMPDAAITRAQFVKMMTEASPSGATSGARAYADVKAGAWFYDCITRAASAGWLSAFTGDEFHPDRAITREEMAVILAAVLRSAGVTAPASATSLDELFSDCDAMNADYLADIELVVRLGIMEGVGGGKFAPTATSTRAQAATVLVRLAKALGNRT